MASTRVCLQWTMIAFNTLSVALGVLAVVASVYELEKYTQGSAEFTEKIVQLAAACVLVASAFVGCCGAVNGSIKILIGFIFMLIALIVTHIWKLWRHNEVKYVAHGEWLVTSTWLEELVRSGAMSELQEMHSCCGKKNHNDYTSLNMKIPQSCYFTQNGLKSLYPFNEGCMTAVKRAYTMISRYEKYAHGCLIGFELLGILLTIILICKLMAKSRKYRY